jgi:hypothetical protein
MKKIFVIIIITQILAGCSDSTSPDEKKHYNLPNQFPLAAGNAWVYERNYYQAEIDSMILDTLYILGMHDDYFKYTWDPQAYYSLVKNQDNKLLSFGQVNLNDPPDTNIYDRPTVWAFFGEDTGYVDQEGLREFYDVLADCLHIRIEKDIEIFNSLYDAYVTSTIGQAEIKPYREQYSTVDGFLEWIYYDLELDEISDRTEMIKKMTNFYPPQKQMNKSGKGKKAVSLYDQQGKKISPNE